MRLPLAALIGSILLGLSPGPGADASVAAPGDLAVFAAGAEAWAFSAEVGIPGPVGPLASHTVASIDNSPHAVGAAGLADPGYLVRAAAGLMLGVPIPTYCESAHPEGPPAADCAAPGGGTGAAQVRTRSGAGPDATSTASLGRVVVPGGPTPVLTVESQSTTSTAEATERGVEARSTAVLEGVSLAGGALRIGTIEVTRTSAADGTDDGLVTSSEVVMSGISVAGQAVDPGTDATSALAEAARPVLGDGMRITTQKAVEERTPGGKLVAASTGLEFVWQAAPDRWAKVVLGFARTLVYAVPGADITDLEGVSDGLGPGPVEPPGAGPGPAVPAPSPPAGDAPVPAETVGGGVRPPSRPPSDAAPIGPSAPSAPAAEPGAPPVRHETAAGGTLQFGSSPRPAVRWVSPFLVLAQMTSGSQIGWFLAAMAPLPLARWGWRRTAAVRAEAR